MECEPQPVIGVDEVGRGCLAGRVYAAAVILPARLGPYPYKDSKLLSVARREVLANEIQSNYTYGIGFATVEEIDSINILRAALLAMRRAVLQLGVTTGHILVDGNQLIPDLSDFSQTTLVKGDLRAAPIAAASIVAKVTRDRYMAELEDRFPDYGFSKHKGYSTPEHKELIKRNGPCIEHRQTFAGVREYIVSAST